MTEIGIDSSTARPRDPRPGPDFLCVGAQKAGTQWVYDQLALHPDFWMPPIKELHHFDLPGTREKKARRIHRWATKDRERYDARRIKAKRRPLEERDIAFLDKFIALPREPDLERYADLFADKGGSIAGDITPGYSVLEPAQIAAIARRFPALRAFYIARNPVDRFWSAFNMRVRRGDVDAADGIAAIRSFAEWRGVARRSSPSTTVRRWRSGLPSGQFALFFFDDVAERPAEVRRSVLAFLGAAERETDGLDAGFNRKAARTGEVMSDEVRAELGKLFAEELRACAGELGGPAAAWARSYGV